MKKYTEAGYSPRNAISSILENNIYGLDIDDRAAQMARFAVLIKAAQYDKGEILKTGQMPQIYCFPNPNKFTLEEVNKFRGKAGKQYANELKRALDEMHQAKNIGSALKLELSDGAYQFSRKLENEFEKGEKANSAEAIVHRQKQPWRMTSAKSLP
jgi:hypothetical protein